MGYFDRFMRRTEEFYIVRACYNADIKYIKDYISSGKSLNVVYKKSSPLFSAVNQHQLEVVKLLLENGADVNFRPNSMDSVIHDAVDTAVYKTFDDKVKYREPPTEIMQLLLDNGAEVNLKNKYGLTPLEMAGSLVTSANCAPQNIIDLLEKYGAK